MRGARALGAAAALLGAAPGALVAQVRGQHWEVTAETARPTVGDTVTLRFRVRLDERDLLFDTVPRPALTPPDWVRILSVEKLERQPDRIFTGRARIAFYRPGRQQVPIFQLPFMRSVKGLSRGTFSSDSAAVEVVPVLTAGSSATLRDIKEPVRAPGPRPVELLIGLAALVTAGWLAWRARIRPPPAAPISAPTAASLSAAPDPAAIALARLAAIEGERWAVRDVARHYAAVADALRDYLEAAEDVPARERTTTELLWALPPHLSEAGLRRRCESLFEAADMVKFARRRPDPASAVRFLAEARELLARWHRAVPVPEVADAIR